MDIYIYIYIYIYRHIIPLNTKIKYKESHEMVLHLSRKILFTPVLPALMMEYNGKLVTLSTSMLNVMCPIARTEQNR